MPQTRTDRATQLRDIAFQIETLASAVEQPSRSIERASWLIAEGERLAKATWAVFRG
jgi:hypothetical protein